MAGLTETGFQRLSLDEVKTSFEEALRSKLGKGLNLQVPGVLGTKIGIESEALALLWEKLEDVYNSQYPDTAFGTSLDNVVSLLGLTRLEATKTRILKQLMFGTVGTIVPSGTIISLSGNPSARFVTDSAVTLIAGTDEVQTLTFSATPTGGSFRLRYLDQDTSLLSFSVMATNIQTALNGLAGLSGVTVTGTFGAGFVITFAGDDGKQDQPLLVVLNNTLVNGITPVTTTLVQTTQGVPQALTTMTAITAGATPAVRGSATVIETLVGGLNRTTNQEDGITGRNTETDNELRIRRGNSLQVAGAGTVDAIRSRIAALEGVIAALVFENTSMITDVNGRPPKSFECVVQGGDPQEIVQTIWDTKPAGIETYGSLTGTALDFFQNNQTIKWSRPTEVQIYVEIDIVKNFQYPVNGDQLVEDAVIAFINSLGIGEDVIVIPQLICAIEVAGILDITVRIGTAPSPTLDNNIVIAPNEIARTDSTKVVVTSV